METRDTSFSMYYSVIFSLVALFLGILSCTPPCPSTAPVQLPEFLLGTSQGGIDEVPFAAELGARWMRGNVSWAVVEPEILTQQLTVADVDSHPEMIAQYISTHNWSASDSLLSEMKAQGLQPLMVVGEGSTQCLPYFQGARVTPDQLGRDNYLGHLYLYARATVERYNGDGEYDAPGGLMVKYWQLENELNQAFLTALWGWRTPSFAAALGSAWQNWKFVTQVLQTLYHAVKTEDPAALTTVNFHTDIPGAINQGFLLPSWQDSIRQWIQWVDFVGIDAYPNYYRPEPVGGAVLGQRILDAADMACDRPIVVIETGYPTGPSVRNYTEAGQAQYIQEAYAAAVNAGAKGFFLFGVHTSETGSVVITPEDLANLDYVAGLFEQGKFSDLLAWALANMDYIENHFAQVLQSVEPYWGLVRSDGTHKPGWDVFHAIANP